MRRYSSKYLVSVLAPIVVFVSVMGDPRVMAQATNEPLLGTWVMNVQKSTFSGAAPDKRTMKFEKVPEGIRHTTDSVNNGGFGLVDSYRLQYTFKIDGKDYPADPAMPVGMVSFRRVDPNTVERTGKYLGEVIETVKYAVSTDGKTMTLTQNGTLNGVEVMSVQVFTRQ
jgi:hypothetical protein